MPSKSGLGRQSLAQGGWPIAEDDFTKRVDIATVLGDSAFTWKAAPQEAAALIWKLLNDKPKDVYKWAHMAAWKFAKDSENADWTIDEGGSSYASHSAGGPSRERTADSKASSSRSKRAGPGPVTPPPDIPGLGPAPFAGAPAAAPSKGPARGRGAPAREAKELGGDEDAQKLGRSASALPKRGATKNLQLSRAVEAEEEVAYAWFRFDPVKTRDEYSGGVQLARISFRHAGVEIPMRNADASNPGGRSPFTAPPAHILDTNPKTKWADVDKKPLLLRFPGPVKVDEFALTTANDLAKKDPVQWSLKGSVDGERWVTLHYQHEDYHTPLKRCEQTSWITVRKFYPTTLELETQDPEACRASAPPTVAPSPPQPQQDAAPDPARPPIAKTSSTKGAKSTAEKKGAATTFTGKEKAADKDASAVTGSRGPPGMPMFRRPKDDKKKEANKSDDEEEEEEEHLHRRSADDSQPDIYRPRTAHGKLADLILKSQRFILFVGFTILANALTIGIEIDAELRDDEDSILYLLAGGLEHIFLVIYIFELALNFIARGRKCLRDTWVKFDLALVCLGVASTWIIGPMFGPGGGGSLDNLLLFRTMRLLRFVRALRLVQAFKPLWKLVSGFAHSASVMMAAMALITLVLFVFACFGAEFIGKPLKADIAAQGELEDPELYEIARHNFASLPLFVLTLVRFATQDALADFYMPIIKYMPSSFVFFVILLMVVTVATMNLVLAAMIEDCIDRTTADMATKKEDTVQMVNRVKPTLLSMFEEMDTAHVGFLNRRQVTKGIKHIKDYSVAEIPQAIRNAMDAQHVESLFAIMDCDLDVGVLSLEDLVEGFARFSLEGVPIELKQILGLLHSTKTKITEVLEKTDRMEREVAGIGLVNGVTEEEKDEALQALDVLEMVRDEGEDFDM